MIEKTWDLNKISDRIQLKAIQQRRPLSCTMELTYRCNFHCKMCYVRLCKNGWIWPGRCVTRACCT